MMQQTMSAMVQLTILAKMQRAVPAKRQKEVLVKMHKAVLVRIQVVLSKSLDEGAPVKTVNEVLVVMLRKSLPAKAQVLGWNHGTVLTSS